MKLNPRALGFTIGSIWGLAISLVTIISLFSSGGYGYGFLYALNSIYPGLKISVEGIALALCYGFVDGFVCGWLVAHLYNFFAKEK